MAECHRWLQEPSKELLPCSPNITCNKNIHQFLETHEKMNPKQHGFRSGRSCLSQPLERHNKILEELEKSNNDNVYVIYLAFEKHLIKSTTGYYWQNRYMDTQFSIKQTTMCCRQWNNSMLSLSKKWRTPSVGPLLFLIHISDINYEIADSHIIMLCP